MKQKQPTKTRDERVEDVMLIITSLEFMKDYPKDERHLKVIAKCVANFAQTVGVKRIYEIDGDPVPDKDGWVVPVEWLFERVAETCEWFPKPIQMRRIYEQKFHPLDGLNSCDMESVIED